MYITLIFIGCLVVCYSIFSLWWSLFVFCPFFIVCPSIYWFWLPLPSSSFPGLLVVMLLHCSMFLVQDHLNLNHILWLLVVIVVSVVQMSVCKIGVMLPLLLFSKGCRVIEICNSTMLHRSLWIRNDNGSLLAFRVYISCLICLLREM